MTLTQVWGALLIFMLCPVLGGLPIIRWVVQTLVGVDLRRVGTGNVSVSAAFYHGGRTAGVLAVLSEMLKGILAVLLARYFFPIDPTWEIVALMALVMGRYWVGKGAGTTNVVWGYLVHDPITAGLVFVIGGISFTLLRERQSGKLGVLVLLPILTALLHPQEGGRILAVTTLSLLMAWIYQKVPDDLDLPTQSATREAKPVFQFLRGNRSLRSLDQLLSASTIGEKAATLSQLKRWGYPVPQGWVLPPGDDPTALIESLQPDDEHPLVVRSSAIGEDSTTASAAGLYTSILNVTSQAALEAAILRCQMSYNLPAAVQYRGDRSSPDGGMAALVQEQIKGVFSGVAFSRDPISRQGDAVVIEALPGGAERVVSGQVTPEQYRVWVHENDVSPPSTQTRQDSSWVMPEDVTLVVEGTGDVPPRLLQQVAYLVRQLELRFRGIPLDMEWTYDGQQLWVLQARPITTLVPIWTRKIAAEVIPGLIHPLTWSINRPLTCGVWGDLFTLVLGERAKGLDFTQTATLHHSSAYFNATLLGDIFLRMGLPPESLEFLTRGAKFSKPPLMATVRNLPGLLRLFQRELSLVQDFATDDQTRFAPALDALQAAPAEHLTATAILDRLDNILQLLNRATYYSILAPLSLALRQALLKPADPQLDNQHSPEVASVRSLYQIAEVCRPLLSSSAALPSDAATVMQTLRTTAGGEVVLAQFDEFLKIYGYLSDVATDVAVPRWREAPETAQALLVQALSNPAQPIPPSPRRQNWKTRQVQQRLTLKGRVTEVYSRLLAELRWSLVALEGQWRKSGLLANDGDLFFLTLDEIRAIVQMPHSVSQGSVTQRVSVRRANRERDRQLVPVPRLVYGNAPPHWNADWMPAASETASLRGIGASPGIVEGWVTVLSNLQTVPDIDRTTILVVPYTDSGWAPLLSQAGGLIAEVGGRLSHGAIIAREYGIPAVMDVHQASQRLRNGQRIRLDGQQGTIEILM